MYGCGPGTDDDVTAVFKIPAVPCCSWNVNDMAPGFGTTALRNTRYVPRRSTLAETGIAIGADNLLTSPVVVKLIFTTLLPDPEYVAPPAASVASVPNVS